MPILDIENLSYAYPSGRGKALDNISLRIEEGEFLAIMGANNAGKSSLCYALTGVIPHLYRGEMKGRVRVRGKDTMESGVAELSTSVALVMQRPETQLSGVRFTVFEEVAFSLENQGMERRRMRKRVQEVLRMTGITELAERPPHLLSGGQLQKVILASALAGDAPVLVLDEPTTFLDPLAAMRIYEILHQLHRGGKTIVLADQRPESVAMYADRVVILSDGKMTLDAPPSEVLVSLELLDAGLDRTRYTRVAALAREQGLWPGERPLPCTLSGTVDGLRNKAEGQDVD